MHGTRWLIWFAVVAVAACSNPTTPPTVGGSTGDFGGSCSCDLIQRELTSDEADEVLGFSAQDVITRVEGEYVLPMVWADLCEGDGPPKGCAKAEPAPAFTGSDTEVRIKVAANAASARVDECNRGATAAECHITSMHFPISASLVSADGLLDEEFALELGTESLDYIGIGGRPDAADLHGELRTEVDGFAGIEWQFVVSETRAIFEVFVLTAATEQKGARLVSRPIDGAESPAGQPFGVAADLTDARQR